VTTVVTNAVEWS